MMSKSLNILMFNQHPKDLVEILSLMLTLCLVVCRLPNCTNGTEERPEAPSPVPILYAEIKKLGYRI